MNSPGSLIVGTAGHIDHGKTSLVRALTGVDTDRLQEEKRRGISIDLGFAHFTLPSGREVSFVDVPGHERFVKNMLAGVGGIDAVLLTVAADEGVKPQTREHFDICRLLDLDRGLIVMTKADLVTPEQMGSSVAAVEGLRRNSFLAEAPIIPFSSATKAGLDRLLDALESLVDKPKKGARSDTMRLPIDRSFVLKGFGTIVTGTLWGGSLRVGDTVRIHPLNRDVRVRGLQTHGMATPAVSAGQRAAVNLSGIDHTEVKRGFVLTLPDALAPTKTLHVVMNWLVPHAEQPSPREDLLLYAGTSEITAGMRTLEGEYREGQSLVQLDLSEGALLLPGDHFVVRRPSPPQTIGGGTVTDAFPPKKLSRGKAAARLRKLHKGDLVSQLELFTSERENGRSLDELGRLTGRSAAQILAAVSGSQVLIVDEASRRILTRDWLARRRNALVTWLEAFHARNPALPGAQVAAARLGLEHSLASFVWRDFAAVQQRGDLIALAGYQPQVNKHEAAALLRIEQHFRSAGYQPASPAEVLRDLGTDPEIGRRLLERLIKDGRLVRITDTLVFHTDVITHIRTSLAVHRGRRFSIPEFKGWTQISRKYAIPLLEYFDHQHVTRREGDNRIVL
ncbi:MAG TPA: selenocysteine-specific translation elongation factor [Bryobacteraceae bacterium]|nr:selenocysteine-specific translation elongation factor [Bryobacteraceae bacterium]